MHVPPNVKALFPICVETFEFQEIIGNLGLIAYYFITLTLLHASNSSGLVGSNKSKE